MVHVPTRGDVPVRLGPSVQLVPDYGPSTMPRDVYTDPMRFELERERVLGAHWIIAGRSEQLAGTGDWLTFEGHGETVVVTRQADGSLAAFHNVCQHRGPAIVGELVGCGAKRFTCPYHGWVYDTTGVVVGVPDREDFDPAAPRRRALARGRRRRVGRLGVDQPRRTRRCAAADRRDRPRDLRRPRPVPDGGHDPPRGARVGRARSTTRRSSTASTRSTTPSSCTTSVRPGPRRPATRRSTSSATTTCASCRGRTTSTSWPRTPTTTATRSATTSCSRTRCSTATPSTSRSSTRSRSTSTARGSCAGS